MRRQRSGTMALLLRALSLAPLAVGSLALTAPAALAETFGEQVMAPELLSALGPGEGQSFRHSRLLPAADPSAPPPVGGYRRLEALEDEHVSIAVTADGKLALQQDGRRVAEFAKSTPHPVLLMFLENVMRGVAQETGGNPHYIRNRMRMTLGAQELSGDSLQIAPFAEDPNRARFGEFGALQIEIRWQPGAPGQLTELTAMLPGNAERYSEIFRVEPKE